MGTLALLGALISAQFSAPLEFMGVQDASVFLGAPLEPAIFGLSDGGYLTVWRDDRWSEVDHGDLFYRTNTSRLSKPLLRAAGDQRLPTIGVLDNQYVVAWETRSRRPKISWCKAESLGGSLECAPQILGEGRGPSFSVTQPSVLGWLGLDGGIELRELADGGARSIPAAPADRLFLVGTLEDAGFGVNRGSTYSLGATSHNDGVITGAGPVGSEPAFLIQAGNTQRVVRLDGGSIPVQMPPLVLAAGAVHAGTCSTAVCPEMAGAHATKVVAQTRSTPDGGVRPGVTTYTSSGWTLEETSIQRTASAPAGAMTSTRAVFAIRQNAQTTVFYYYKAENDDLVLEGFEPRSWGSPVVVLDVGYLGETALAALRVNGQTEIVRLKFGQARSYGTFDGGSLVVTSGSSETHAHAFFFAGDSVRGSDSYPDGGIGGAFSMSPSAEAFLADCTWASDQCATFHSSIDGGTGFFDYHGYKQDIDVGGEVQALTHSNEQFHMYWLDGGSVLERSTPFNGDGGIQTRELLPWATLRRLRAAAGNPPIIAVQTADDEILVGQAGLGRLTQVCDGAGAPVLADLADVLTPADHLNARDAGAIRGAVLLRTTVTPIRSLAFPFVLTTPISGHFCDGGLVPSFAEPPSLDGGVSDAAVPDAGVFDAGLPDSGLEDGGLVDSGVDAGASDAGSGTRVDGGTFADGGHSEVDLKPNLTFTSCGCSSGSVLAWALGAILLRRRRAPNDESRESH